MTDNPVNKYQRRTTLISGGVFHFYHDGIADGMAVFLPLWQAAFGLSLSSVGLLVTCFEGATGFFQIPAGFISERFGERALLVTGTMITAIAFICLWLSEGVISLIILLFIGGAGAAVQHPLASSIVSKVYSGKGRRLALGTYNFSGDIGKFFFPALAAFALSGISWRSLCAVLGLFGCVLTVTLFFILKHTRVGERNYYQKNQKIISDARKWGIRNRGAFITLSVIAILDTAVRIGLVSFGPFLFIQKGVQPESVGFALSLMLAGGAAGKFTCGELAERAGTIVTIVITEIITGLGILLLTFLPLSLLYLFLPVLGAALNGTSSVLYGTVADFVNPNRVARAFGLFYTFVIAAAAIAPPIVGNVSDMLGIYDSIRLIGVAALSTVPMAAILWKQMSKQSRIKQRED